MRELVFRFKKFECSHSESSMKIGVDAVLVGAWCDVTNARKILDVGTGCGVIALMCAQRNFDSLITGIDIDEDSVTEARKNFERSPWRDRLTAVSEDFTITQIRDVDLIVSNPPYFNSGVTTPESSRLRARHQDILSPKVLLERGREILSRSGRICMILPYEQADELTDYAANIGFSTERRCDIKGNENAPTKRSLLQFAIGKLSQCRYEHLTLETSPGEPTREYRALCKDFYLKF